MVLWYFSNFDGFTCILVILEVVKIFLLFFEVSCLFFIFSFCKVWRKFGHFIDSRIF